MPSGSKQSPGAFSLTFQQARHVAVVIEFLRAYNAGDVEAALAVLSDNVIVSDCDYRNAEAVEFTGKRAVAEWLKGRFADHDKLFARRIFNESPGSNRAVGIEYARRTSDTLRALGFRDGVKPKLATKVGFSRGGDIAAFANGPIGGPPELCRPGTG